jgi:hypothetical protein
VSVLTRRDFTRLAAAACLAGRLAAPSRAGRAAPAEAPASRPSDLIDGDSVETRCAALVDWLATSRPDAKSALSPKAAMAYAAARLVRGVGADDAVRQIAAMARRHDLRGDHAFAGHATMHAFLVGRGRIGPDVEGLVREYLQDWDYADAGFSSSNYKLMTFATGFLAGETWPAFRDAKGRVGGAVCDVTRPLLEREFDQIVRRNLDEYSAPIYFGTDFAPVRMLAEFARDDAMRTRSRLVLEWMLLNLACHWNQGYHVATSGRCKYWGSTNTGPDSPTFAAAVAWLHFGGLRGTRAARTDPSGSFWAAYPGAHAMPPAIAAVARKAGAVEPFVCRTSAVVPRSFTVRQTTWHARGYSVASQWEQTGGPRHHLPKETRRMVLRWLSEKPSSTFIVANANYQRPYKLDEVKPNAFGYGETPYGQVMQHEGTLLGLQDVPAEYAFYRLYAVFPTSGAIVARAERDGWILCHGGSALFAFKASRPGAWGPRREGNDVYLVDARRGGWALETSEIAPFAGGGTDAELTRFADAVCAANRLTFDLSGATPTAAYRTLSGRTLSMAYAHPWAGVTDNHRVDGRPIEYGRFPLMGSPWVSQEVDSPRLTVKVDGRELEYDFDRWISSGADGAGGRR